MWSQRYETADFAERQIELSYLKINLLFSKFIGDF